MNIALLNVITPAEYCEAFTKTNTTVDRVWLVQRCDGKPDGFPYNKFVLMQSNNVWILAEIGIVPQQNLQFDREKGKPAMSKMYFTQGHAWAFKDATFDQVYLAAIYYTMESLNPVKYPL